jgi:hypothetical protein
MFEKLSTWVMLLVLLLTPTSGSPFTSDTVVRVTVGVLDRYHSTCVYLLHTTHQQGECHEAVTDSCHIMAVCGHSGRRCCRHTGLVSVTFLKTLASVPWTSGNAGIVTAYHKYILLRSKYCLNKTVLNKNSRQLFSL